MELFDHVFLIPFIIALLISLEVGVFAIIRYRARLALWCGLILLSLALELGCYLVLFTSPPPPIVRMFSLIQVISYSFFCVFWLLFVFTFTRHSHWINPLTMMIIIGLPAVYSVMMLIQGSTLNLTAGAGSLMLSPQKYEISGVFFLAYAYAADFFTLFLLVRFYSKANLTLRKLIPPLLVGPILLALAGGLELAGYNPFPPVSIQQLACSFCSLVGFFVVIDFRAGNIIREAQEMAFAQMQDGILILDVKDRIIEMNFAAQRIVGISPKSGLNKILRSVWLGKCDLISAQSEANIREGECAILVNDLECTFDVTVSPIVDGYNELNGRIVALRNVTDRERIEKALSDRSQELIRTNSFLAALAGIVVNLQTMTDPAHILDKMGSELYALGLRCFIARLEPEFERIGCQLYVYSEEFACHRRKTFGRESYWIPVKAGPF